MRKAVTLKLFVTKQKLRWVREKVNRKLHVLFSGRPALTQFYQIQYVVMLNGNKNCVIIVRLSYLSI